VTANRADGLNILAHHLAGYMDENYGKMANNVAKNSNQVSPEYKS
jgi:hypothetical protein